MSNRVTVDPTGRNSHQSKASHRGGFPSLRLLGGGLLLVALVLALGMTGGQVRQLAGRVSVMEDEVSAMEGERDMFERRVDQMRDDNQQLIVKLRDYQEVLELAQGSNISLSKRVHNREQAVSDLQDSLDSILEEKYATENQLRGQIAGLENVKKDLSAQVAALSQAMAAQIDEIEQLDRSYRQAERDLTSAGEANSSLLAENDRYLGMMSQLQDEIEALHSENRQMVEGFDILRSEAEILEQEKFAIQQELELIKNTAVEPLSVAPATSDPFNGEDPFELEESLPGDRAGDEFPGSEVASADDGGSA